MREAELTLTHYLMRPGYLSNWDVDKAERFNAFFVPILNSNNCPWVPEPEELKDNNWRKYELPANAGFVCSLLIQLDAHKSYGTWWNSSKVTVRPG